MLAWLVETLRGNLELAIFVALGAGGDSPPECNGSSIMLSDCQRESPRPDLLGVAYTLVDDWVSEERRAEG